MYGLDRLRHYTARLREAHGLPGSVCLVRHRGRSVFEEYAGTRDRAGQDPMRPDAIFRLFSMTKVVTCVAALQLMEAGHYRLSDPLADYLPAYRQMQCWDEAAGEPVPCRTPLRVRDLFTMSAGLSYADDETPASRAQRDALYALHRREPQFSTRQFADALATAPLCFEPGSRWQYSLAHDVLAAFVEVVSGQRFSDYLEEHIFAPLGMADTAFWVPEEKRGRLVELVPEGAERSDGLSENALYQMMSGVERIPYESGGGGLKGTMSDYMAFADCLTHMGTSVDGVRILSRGTVELMRRNHLDPRRQADFWLDTMAGYGYGLGVRTMVDPALAGSNGCVGEFGWAGMAGTWFMMDPAAELTLVFGQQRIPNLEAVYAPVLRNLAYACLS